MRIYYDGRYYDIHRIQEVGRRDRLNLWDRNAFALVRAPRVTYEAAKYLMDSYSDAHETEYGLRGKHNSW